MRQKRVRVSQRRALATAQNRPTVLLAAKTYGKGVLNPLFSSVFAHVRAENPIFSKTCRRWGKPNTRVTSRKVGHLFWSQSAHQWYTERPEVARNFAFSVWRYEIKPFSVWQSANGRPNDGLWYVFRRFCEIETCPTPSRQPDTLRLVT